MIVTPIIHRTVALTLLYTLFQALIGMNWLQAQEPTNTEKSLLWKISGNGLTTSSYLFGTIHHICQDKYLWTPAMQSAFDQADKVCLEMDLDDPQVQMEMMKGMISTDGKTLDSYFSEAEYTALKQYLTDRNPNNPVLAALNNLNPIGIYMMMIQDIVQCQIGDKTSYEMNLLEMASKAKKEIVGLEAVADQMHALQSISTDTIIKYINALVSTERTEKEVALFDELVDYYINQDIVGLKKLMDKQGNTYGSMNVILDDRNQKWIPNMEQMMQQQTIFFAVGAGHLAGPQGVIALLRNKGYTVEVVQ